MRRGEIHPPGPKTGQRIASLMKTFPQKVQLTFPLAGVTINR